jgi:TPR repeat protein
VIYITDLNPEMEIGDQRLAHGRDRAGASARASRRLFEQAAGQGDGEAMNNPGTLYHNGRGVARDRKLAKQWYEKAAALGVAEAKENLKGM